MGAQKSIHAGKAKIDINVDLTHKLCTAFLSPPLRNSGDPFSHIIARLCIKHPSVFGRREKLDFLWSKGLCDSDLFIAFRRPKTVWSTQQSFIIQHSITPDIEVHGLPADHFSRSASGGVNLCRLSVGIDLNEASTSNWSSSTSVRFENVRAISDDGRSLRSDFDGFPITCSGGLCDNMVILKQESRYSDSHDNCFSRFSCQMEQGLPLLSNFLIFNRVKVMASKGIKLGPSLLVTSLTGGSIVGDMAPHQAFSIGGISTVRGYGEGAVGSGRSCLIANSEVTIPLAKELDGIMFIDCGTDLGTARHVPGNPAVRRGKPGFGLGVGCGLRFNSRLGQLQFDYVVNAFRQKTIYFGINKATA